MKQHRLFLLVSLSLVLAVLMAAQAFAEGLTVLAGVSQFTPQSDGVWYQKIFPYQLNMTSPSVGLRYDTSTSASGWSYSGGYMNLGRVTSSAIAVGVDAPGDGGYDAKTQSCVGGCMATSHWYGSGEVQGVWASAAKHWGPWALEAGLYVYKPTWKMDIPDWRACRDCRAMSWPVAHDAYWQVGPMLGLRYSVDKWSLNLSMWHTQTEGDGFTALYHNQTYDLSVGYEL